MDGNGLKNKSMNKTKVIIYQMPLLERIMGIFSAIFLTLIPIACLILGFERKLEMIILLLVMIAYCAYMYFLVFKTYMCLDIKNKKLIIREFPGIKKRELSLENIKGIQISDDPQYKQSFTIDINYMGYTEKIISWSAHPTCRLALFGVYRRQTKRLKKFAKKCNAYLTIKENLD